jgi:hypothetical protein
LFSWAHFYLSSFFPPLVVADCVDLRGWTAIPKILSPLNLDSQPGFNPGPITVDASVIRVIEGNNAPTSYELIRIWLFKKVSPDNLAD